ncbi:hypothetical protein N656DRAFT_781609 [Canariomyces notabilis]|uniref:Uncharacterized protein n=1 Tax=Canariomyces notabilis TaxID=2074819 RepID=A0AAN6QIT6_9PEZI|nr:hypothetical protein N656DRAFT_781609 [Canariomyces arenarius]
MAHDAQGRIPAQTFITQFVTGKIDNGNVTKLVQEPILRPVRLAKGKDDLYYTPDWHRASRVEAALIFMTGKISEKKCDRCAKNLRPFASCVVSDVAGRGACANCHSDSRGAHCSLRHEAAQAGGKSSMWRFIASFY